MTFLRFLITRVSFYGLAALLAIPVFAQETTSRKESSSSSRTTMQWSTSTGATDFNIELRGEMEITDDDKDIKSMSDDGYLEINKTVFGSKRTIIVESLGGGRLKKQYYEGRTEMKWEPNGREWLAEILPEIVRNTGIGAASRVPRFFKKGGTAAVLGEIGKMESDHAKTIYARLLMKEKVPPGEYAHIINTMSEEIGSDHYLTEFLKDNTDKFMGNASATAALLSATRSMDSDHYKTIVIKQALDGQMASLPSVKIILQAAGQMESDHYITEVLTSVLKQDNLDDAIVAELVATTNTIESDHYKTVVLTRALDKPGLSAVAHQKVIESIDDIESDHYITQVISHLLESKLTDPLLTLLLEVTGSIESDHYRTEVLNTLMSRQDLTDAQLNRVLGSSAMIDSDHYLSTVLINALRISNISEKQLVSILNATAKIGSDHYITQVLVTAAPKVKSAGSPARDAYRTAARNISSDTYYGRALKAIDQ